MKTITLTLAALASFATFAAGTKTARADHFGDVEGLAYHVQSHSRELYSEIRYHVGYGFSGRHLMSDAAEMYRLAVRIRSNAHAGWNLNAICRDARQLDKLTHHMQEIVDDMDHGHAHHHGHGHSHAGELRHIRRLLRLVEQDVHELVEEVERLEHSYSHLHGQPGLSVGPGGVYFGGKGISLKVVK